MELGWRATGPPRTNGGAVYAPLLRRLQVLSATLRSNTAVRGAGGAIASAGIDQYVSGMFGLLCACVGYPLATAHLLPRLELVFMHRSAVALGHVRQMHGQECHHVHTL